MSRRTFHLPEKKFFASLCGTAAILFIVARHPTDGVCEAGIASLVSLWLGLVATHAINERRAAKANP